MHTETWYTQYKARVTASMKNTCTILYWYEYMVNLKVWILPVIICGSAAWHLTVATAFVCPDNVCTLALVLTSQIYKKTHTHTHNRHTVKENRYS